MTWCCSPTATRSLDGRARSQVSRGKDLPDLNYLVPHESLISLYYLYICYIYIYMHIQPLSHLISAYFSYICQVSFSLSKSLTFRQNWEPQRACRKCCKVSKNCVPRLSDMTWVLFLSGTLGKNTEFHGVCWTTSSGWWLNPTPLRNMIWSIGMMIIPNWMEIHKSHVPVTTNHLIVYWTTSPFQGFQCHRISHTPGRWPCTLSGIWSSNGRSGKDQK